MKLSMNIFLYFLIIISVLINKENYTFQIYNHIRSNWRAQNSMYRLVKDFYFYQANQRKTNKCWKTKINRKKKKMKRDSSSMI